MPRGDDYPNHKEQTRVGLSLGRRRAFLPGIALILCLLPPACGYRFSGPGQLPGGVQQVHVAVLENPTAETGIEAILSNALIRAFTLNGHHTAPRPNKADAILSGRISSLHLDTVARVNAQTATYERVALTLDLNLTGSDGRRLWAADGIAASEAYGIVRGNKAATEANRRAAIRILSGRLAEMVYDRLTTAF